jgi:glycosyltransferase involved in cell wall biosynthesis
MPAVTLLIPGDLDARTGGYEYDRRIAEGLRARGWDVAVRGLDPSFPRPTPEALVQSDMTLSAIADGAAVLVDGLALGAMPDQIEKHAGRLRLVALVHHPLALETGLDAATAGRLRESERRALASVNRVVVTSHRTAAALADYDVPRDHIVVVEPGTDSAPLAAGSGGGPVSLLCVAALLPRKGHEVLFRALGRLRDKDWRLVCVGSTEREPEMTRRLRMAIEEQGIADRVELAGEADATQMRRFYDRTDVFVLPTLYEGFGMAVAEALARGVPVISTPTGAIGDLVGDQAGILVPAGDVDGWARALEQMFDPVVRARFGAGARARRRTLSTWEVAADLMAEALDVDG